MKIKFSLDKKRDLLNLVSVLQAVSNCTCRSRVNQSKSASYRTHFGTNCSYLILDLHCTKFVPTRHDNKAFSNIKSNTYHACLIFSFEARDIEVSIHLTHYTKQLWWSLVLMVSALAHLNSLPPILVNIGYLFTQHCTSHFPPHKYDT